MSKKIEQTKEVIAKIVKEGFSQFLWDKKFDIHTVASRLAYRGIRGKDIWNNELLEIVLTPYREHVTKQELDEAQVDEDLKFFAEKIGVAHDKIRKRFYALEFEQPKEQPATARKEEPRAPKTSKEPTESEENIDLHVDEE